MWGMMNSLATLPNILFGEQHISYRHVSNNWGKLTCLLFVVVAGIAGNVMRCVSSKMCSTACSPFGNDVKCGTSVVLAGHALHFAVLHFVVFSLLWIGTHTHAKERSRHSLQKSLSGAAISPDTLGVSGALVAGVA